MKRDLTLILDRIEYSLLVADGSVTVNDRTYTVEVVDGNTILVDGIAYHHLFLVCLPAGLHNGHIEVQNFAGRSGVQVYRRECFGRFGPGVELNVLPLALLHDALKIVHSAVVR